MFLDLSFFITARIRSSKMSELGKFISDFPHWFRIWNVELRSQTSPNLEHDPIRNIGPTVDLEHRFLYLERWARNRDDGPNIGTLKPNQKHRTWIQSTGTGTISNIGARPRHRLFLVLTIISYFELSLFSSLPRNY
jgi:hypothetical protein